MIDITKRLRVLQIEKILVLSSLKENIIQLIKLLATHGLKPSDVKENGVEGLRLLSEAPFDLVICDYKLRLVNGWLAAQEIKSSDKIPNIPIMMIGREDLNIADNALEEYGIVKYLKFPITQSQFDFTLNSTMNLFKTSGTIESKYTVAKDALIQSDNTKQAVELFTELHSLTQKGGRSSMGLAQAFEKNQEADKAQQVITEAAQSGAISPSGQLMSIRLLLKNQEIDKAIAVSERLIGQDPGPYYYVKACELLFQYHLLDVVEKICRDALDKKYEMAEFYLNLARCCIHREKMDEGMELLVSYEQKFSTTSDVLNLKGTVFRHKKQFQDALKCYEEGIRLSPRSAKTYFNLAMCSIDMGDQASAEHYLESAITLNKSFTQAIKALEDLRRKSAS